MELGIELEDIFSYLENIFDEDILGKVFLISDYMGGSALPPLPPHARSGPGFES